MDDIDGVPDYTYLLGRIHAYYFTKLGLVVVHVELHFFWGTCVHEILHSFKEFL